MLAPPGRNRGSGRRVSAAQRARTLRLSGWFSLRPSGGRSRGLLIRGALRWGSRSEEPRKQGREPARFARSPGLCAVQPTLCIVINRLMDRRSRPPAAYAQATRSAAHNSSCAVGPSISTRTRSRTSIRARVSVRMRLSCVSCEHDSTRILVAPRAATSVASCRRQASRTARSGRPASLAGRFRSAAWDPSRPGPAPSGHRQRPAGGPRRRRALRACR